MRGSKFSRRAGVVALSVSLLCTACLLESNVGSEEKLLRATAESALAEALAALSAGDYNLASTKFSDAGLHPDFACESDYGLALSALLGLIADIDDLLDLYGLVAGAPGLTPAQTVNVDRVAETFLAPFEQRFAAIREPGRRAIDNRCVLLVPDAFPIRLGAPESVFYLDAKIGYEFDPAVLRGVLSGVELMQALIDFVLAHRLQFNDQVQKAFEVVQESLEAWQDSEDAVESEELAETERQTLIGVVRSAGVLFDVDSAWLDFRDRGRMNAVDDDLERSFRLIFHRLPDGSETGILEDLFWRAGEDTQPTDNALAILDHDKNGAISDGDEILFGLRSLEYGFGGETCEEESLFEVSGIGLTEGVRIRLKDREGRLTEFIRLYKEFIQALGDQMEAVEDPNVAWRRVGIADINAMAFYIAPEFEPIPEVLEFDARAFFTNPVPVRGYLPYWYDDANDDLPTDVFLIEGEVAVTTVAEPYLKGLDSAHFDLTVTFGTVGQTSPQVLTDLKIEADGIFAPEEGWDLLPYIGWQRPSFNGLLYINSKNMPVAPEGDNAFAEATLYMVNKLTHSLLVHYVDGIDAAAVEGEEVADIAESGNYGEFCDL